jgi:methionine-rich copper-binding protein CopC
VDCRAAIHDTMRSIPVRTVTSRGTALLAALVTTLATVLAPATPVSAHANFVGSIPAAGSTVTTAPTNVRVFFSSAVKINESGLTVTGPSGARIDQNDSTVQPDPNRQTIRISLLPGIGPGEYTVNWHNVAEDGHHANGSFKFTISNSSTPQQSGRDFTLSTRAGPATHLTWGDGTQEDNYVLFRLATPGGLQSFAINANATSYTDSPLVPGVTYCYMLVVRSGTNVVGNTNIMCTVPGMSTVGEIIPGPEIEATLAMMLEELQTLD